MRPTGGQINLVPPLDPRPTAGRGCPIGVLSADADKYVPSVDVFFPVILFGRTATRAGWDFARLCHWGRSEA